MFIRDWDEKEFEFEQEAFDDALNEMLDGYGEDYLKPWVGYNELLTWAMKQDGFFDAFEDDLYKAQRDFFNDFYVELKDDEDND